MKRVRTSDLCPGMKTAEDVYSYNNQMILPKDTVLDDKTITRLEFYSVLAIRVCDDVEAPVEVASEEASEISLESSYSQRVRSSKQFKEFESNFLETTETFKGSLQSIANDDGDINTDELIDSVTNLMSNDMTGYSVFDMLHNMRQYDDFTYMHSMNVALICNVFGKWLDLRDDQIKTVTIAGLLHDIGKIKVPDNIIRKPDKLSPAEYSIVKTHTLQGYNILKDKDIDNNIKEAALMHHERCDGSGYPLGISDAKINPYAKIVAIADVYDAMTAARIYRGPLCPFRVISIFESEGLRIYDSRFILVFLEHIANTYMNNRVRLSNGQEGEVIFMNKCQYSRPMIQSGSEFIDLSKRPDLYIETFV